jgi:hypothetical protein
MAVRDELEGSEWRCRVAKWMLPHVVAAANSGSTIEYGECRSIIEKEHGLDEAKKVARM